MRVVIFHRAEKKYENPQSQNQNQQNLLPKGEQQGNSAANNNNPQNKGQDKQKQKPNDGNRLFYNLSVKKSADGEQILSVSLRGKVNNRKVASSFEVPMRPNSLCVVEYFSILDKVIVRDVRAGNDNSDQRGEFIARILSTSTETLVYLTRVFHDIPGFKNIIRKDEERSAEAFFRYSPESKRIFTEAENRREFFSRVDPRDSLSYLEAQVDILTRIILEEGIGRGTKWYQLLLDADKHGVERADSFEKLQKKMNEKGDFRKKQQEFLANKKLTLEDVFG